MSTTATTWCTCPGRSTTWTTRPTSSSSAASWASTRPPSWRPRATGEPAVGRPSACWTRPPRNWSTGAGPSTGSEVWQTDPVSTAAIGQLTGPGPGKVRAFLRLVMIEHSVFALPFALIAAFTAMWQQSRSVHWWQLLLIVLAMVSARTVAMAGNRILDRRYDALNPRTAQRELVTGALSVTVAWRGFAIALLVFLACAAALGPLPLLLSPVAVGLLILYSYGKRFTDFPQVLLALAQAVA